MTITNSKPLPTTSCITHCWQRFAVVFTLGQAVLNRPQSALNTQRVIHANVVGYFKIDSMKVFFTQLIILFSLFTNAQQKETTIARIDTLALGKIEEKKIVRYSIRNVQICIAAQTYLNSVESMRSRWKEYYSGTKQYKVIDSIYNYVKKQIKIKDTIDLSQQVFDKVGLLSPVSFDLLIDEGECEIYDEKGIRQLVIIRKNEYYHCGPLCAWGGRRYYLVNKENYFYEATDWIS